MIRMILAGAAALALTATATAAPKPAAKPAAAAKAAPVRCTDPKTKRFIKCGAPAAAAATGGVTKDKNGRCHVASGPKKGQFTKCP